MKISILLPYKENFSDSYAGAVSIFISDTLKKSKFRKKTHVYGNTFYKNYLLKNYINLELKKNFFSSFTKNYLEKFKEKEKSNKSDLIEIHNRPNYISYLLDLDCKNLVLYFHNDPLEMNGSKLVNERINLIKNLRYLVFNSNWSKNRFLKDLEISASDNSKLIVINQSTNKVKINFKKKRKIIVFVGKLNTAKGYDLFGKSILKILDKYPEWSSIVIGDEPRQQLSFQHQNLQNLGFQKHNKVLKILESASISVVCSRWDEPFGRVSLESASRGCAVIISNKGGLPETIKNRILIKKLNEENVYNSIKKLITNEKLRISLQKKSVKNFINTNEKISKEIDEYRSLILREDKKITNIKNLKIIHVTNFNSRHNGRLFYNTGRRINNGLVRLNHSVLTISDRDVISLNRKIIDPNGIKKLNQTLLDTLDNYVPDVIILGHADGITNKTISIIRSKYPKIKLCQWFLDRMDKNWEFNKKRFLDKIDQLDCSFCTSDPKKLGLKKKYKIFFIPNPVDISFENINIYKNKNFLYDVFFAMSHGVHRGVLKKGKFDDREIFINKLKKLLPNIKFDLYGMNNRQPIWGDKYKQALSNSYMGINLSQGKSTKYYSSDRIAQLMGNGILTFLDKKSMLDTFFNNKEAIFYSSIQDLAKKINFYSKNIKLAKQIARNGKKKYFKYFNSNLVAKFILDRTFGIKTKYMWDND